MDSRASSWRIMARKNVRMKGMVEADDVVVVEDLEVGVEVFDGEALNGDATGEIMMNMKTHFLIFDSFETGSLFYDGDKLEVHRNICPAEIILFPVIGWSIFFLHFHFLFL